MSNIDKGSITDYHGQTVAPLNPPAGQARLFYNSTTNAFHGIDSTGTDIIVGSGASGTPGGADSDIQVNVSNAFSGTSAFTLVVASSNRRQLNINTAAGGGRGEIYLGNQTNGFGLISIGSGVILETDVSNNLTFLVSGTITINTPLDIVGDATATAVGLGLGAQSGFGNGAPSAVTTTLTGTGTGPTTPQTIVNYLEINLAGTTYWIPLVQ